MRCPKAQNKARWQHKKTATNTDTTEIKKIAHNKSEGQYVQIASQKKVQWNAQQNKDAGSQTKSSSARHELQLKAHKNNKAKGLHKNQRQWDKKETKTY